MCGMQCYSADGQVKKKMNADFLNAILVASSRVFSQELKGPIRRTGLQMDPTDQVTDEVTVYVALVGRIRGMVMVGMSTATARQVASIMVGESQPELSELGLSALAELGNLIAGGSTVELERLGYPSDITPPTIMIGRKSRLSTLGLPRFVIPLATPGGDVNIHVAVDVMAPS